MAVGPRQGAMQAQFVFIWSDIFAFLLSNVFWHVLYVNRRPGREPCAPTLRPDECCPLQMRVRGAYTHGLIHQRTRKYGFGSANLNIMIKAARRAGADWSRIS